MTLSFSRIIQLALALTFTFKVSSNDVVCHAPSDGRRFADTVDVQLMTQETQVKAKKKLILASHSFIAPTNGFLLNEAYQLNVSPEVTIEVGTRFDFWNDSADVCGFTKEKKPRKVCFSDPERKGTYEAIKMSQGGEYTRVSLTKAPSLIPLREAIYAAGYSRQTVMKAPFGLPIFTRELRVKKVNNKIIELELGVGINFIRYGSKREPYLGMEKSFEKLKLDRRSLKDTEFGGFMLKFDDQGKKKLMISVSGNFQKPELLKQCENTALKLGKAVAFIMPTGIGGKASSVVFTTDDRKLDLDYDAVISF